MVWWTSLFAVCSPYCCYTYTVRNCMCITHKNPPQRRYILSKMLSQEINWFFVYFKCDSLRSFFCYMSRHCNKQIKWCSKYHSKIVFDSLMNSFDWCYSKINKLAFYLIIFWMCAHLKIIIKLISAATFNWLPTTPKLL